jgi:dienelactone hydrolase
MNTNSNPYPYRVLLKRGEFVDSDRDGRVVPYKIYYPVEHDLEKMPVIIWSHGFGGSHDGASFISRFIASQGYTIVHVTHKGTDSSLWEGKEGHPWDILRDVKITPELVLERVRDIPFVLDCLEHLSEESPEVARYMDKERIGMSGHSFGAITTQAMAGMKLPDGQGGLIDMHDERFSCAIAYSPVPLSYLSDAPPEDIYGSIRIPMLHMTGTDDVSPLKKAIDYKQRLIVREYAGNKEQYLQVLDGGDHMIYNGTRGKLEHNPLREEHEALILDAVLAFWQAYLKDDSEAKAWLQEHYV